jgi:hypothetical protein
MAYGDALEAHIARRTKILEAGELAAGTGDVVAQQLLARARGGRDDAVGHVLRVRALGALAQHLSTTETPDAR